MLTISIFSNIYITFIAWIYFAFLHIYFIQYYFYEVANRIIASHFSTNKVGISLVYALFMSIATCVGSMSNIDASMNRSTGYLFGSFCLGMTFLMLLTEKTISMPKTGEYFFIAFLLGCKEILWRENVSLSNGLLNAMTNILFLLYFIKVLIEKFNRKGPIIINDNSGDVANLRYHGRSIVPVQQPSDSSDVHVVRRTPMPIVPIEAINLKKWLNLVFYAFEVIFDNLLVNQQTKRKSHTLNIYVRALVSPIIFVVMLNIAMDVRTLPTYLAILSFGVFAGVCNFYCVRFPKLYKFLNIYNMAVVVLIETFILNNTMVNGILFKQTPVNTLVIELLNIIQVSIPYIFLAIVGARSGFQGIVFSANVIAFGISSFFYACLSNTMGIFWNLAAMNKTLQISLIFHAISSIVPYLICLLYRRSVSRNTGCLVGLIVPSYCVFVNGFLQNIKKSN